MSTTNTGDGKTPLSAEELEDLIPNLATKEELNEWERENILQARGWAMEDGTGADELATDEYVRKLHLKMFDATWKWAGRYRRTEKNIGVPPNEIRERLASLLGDARYWIEHSTYPPDEIAVRFHHRLVFIHPFSNGNGRHARLMADMLAIKLGRPTFSWGDTDLITTGEARNRYLQCIRLADEGNIQPLLEFARS